MKKSIYNILFISFVSLATLSSLSSCSGNNQDNTDAIEVNGDRSDTDPVDYIHGSSHLTSTQIDSLANQADFLSPGQGVGVLWYFSQTIEKSSGRNKTEKMVAFKDLYNILASNYGSDFQTALRKLQSRHHVDLKSIFEEITDRFNGADDESGSISADEVRNDTIPTDSINPGVEPTPVEESL